MLTTRLLAAMLGAGAILGLTACGTTTTSNNFKGDSHGVAQTINDLQNDASSRNNSKICSNDLATTVVTRLSAASGGCAAVIKNQLNEVDTFTLSVKSVNVNSTASPPTATAVVKSTSAGKDRLDTLTLVKEGSRWKVSGLG